MKCTSIKQSLGHLTSLEGGGDQQCWCPRHQYRGQVEKDTLASEVPAAAAMDKDVVNGTTAIAV